jgi:hypothetical protein
VTESKELPLPPATAVQFQTPTQLAARFPFNRVSAHTGGTILAKLIMPFPVCTKFHTKKFFFVLPFLRGRMYSPCLIATALNGSLVYKDDEEVQAKMLRTAHN